MFLMSALSGKDFKASARSTGYFDEDASEIKMNLSRNSSTS